MSYKLHAYQERARDHILDNPHSAIFLNIGFGKTLVGLDALECLTLLGKADKVLIISTKRIAEHTWTDEIEKFGFDYSYRKLVGFTRAQQAILALKDKSHIHIINVDNIAHLVHELKNKFPYDCVIFDELSLVKNSASKRFKALRLIRPFLKSFIGMTGTPSPNGLIDLWAQMWCVDMGVRLEPTLGKYRTKYFSNNQYTHGWDLRKGSDKLIHDKIRDIVFTLDANDYIDLPDIMFHPVKVDMPKKSIDMYNEMEKEYIIQVDDGHITAANGGAKAMKLLQIASGAVYGEDSTINYLHTAKIDAIKELIDDAQGKPVLIGYTFRFEAEMLRKHLGAVDIRDKGVTPKKWNDGEIPILMGHPASMGHGLNLQKGSNILIWISLPWSLEHFKQMNGRLARQGQDQDSVHVYHVQSNNTLDEAVFTALNKKDGVQTSLLDTLAEHWGVTYV